MAKYFTPIRFYVEWHPTAEIEAECIKEGMKPDDGTSFWDLVNIPNCAKTKVFQKFDEAVAFALLIASQDYFGGARVYRQEQKVIKDAKCSYIRWEDECYWDGLNGDDQPDINKPDQYCE